MSYRESLGSFQRLHQGFCFGDFGDRSPSSTTHVMLFHCRSECAPISRFPSHAGIHTSVPEIIFREVYCINLEANTCLIRARDVLKWMIQYHWDFKPGLGSSCLSILTILDCWFCRRRTAAKKKIGELFQCLKWKWQNLSLQSCTKYGPSWYSNNKKSTLMSMYEMDIKFTKVLSVVFTRKRLAWWLANKDWRIMNCLRSQTWASYYFPGEIAGDEEG